MSSVNGDSAAKALEVFDATRGEAGQAWQQAFTDGEEPTLQDLQARAIIAGLEATSLLLQNLLNGLPPSESPSPVRHQVPMSGSRGQAEKVLLTSNEAAKEAGVSQASVRRWADAGEIEVFHTPGGQRRFRPGAVQQAMQR